jgi:AraC family transcriptional regulator
MKVTVEVLGSAREPYLQVHHEQLLCLLLRPGAIEEGFQRSAMTRFIYDAGEMGLCPRHVETWIRPDDAHVLKIDISDGALRAACDEISGEVELRSTGKLADARVVALAAAVNAERLAGFPSGRLFLDSVEQALAVALVEGHAVRHRSVPTFRGGLAPARLRRVVELVHARIEEEVTLSELAESAGLSTAHFSQMFRKSTGASPHQFVLRQRVERAKELLCAAETRVLDVAVACGFKSQQHFARVFRRMCGASPTEYRQNFCTETEPSPAASTQLDPEVSDRLDSRRRGILGYRALSPDRGRGQSRLSRM